MEQSGPVIYRKMMRQAETILASADEQTIDAVNLANSVMALNKRLTEQPDFPREWISI